MRPPVTVGLDEDALNGDQLIALSARLRKKERDLENLRLELADGNALTRARAAG